MRQNLISYDDLSKLNLHEELDTKTLNFKGDEDDITITKILSSENEQNFRVTMKKGALWKNHIHDCRERIVLFEGVISNGINNVIIEKFKPYCIYKYMDHSVKAIEDSIFYVEFKKLT